MVNRRDICCPSGFFAAPWAPYGPVGPISHFAGAQHRRGQVTFTVFVLIIPLLYLLAMAFLCCLPEPVDLERKR